MTNKVEVKRVQWKATCNVRLMPMVAECDHDQVWYSRSDYRSFKRERKAATALGKAIGLKAMEETDFVTCLGIEYLVDEALLQSKIETQRRACIAVLAAQEQEYHEAKTRGESEPNLCSSELIPDAYSTYSERSQKKASEQALRQWKIHSKQEDDSTQRRPTMTRSSSIRKRSSKTASSQQRKPPSSIAIQNKSLFSPPRRVNPLIVANMA